MNRTPTNKPTARTPGGITPPQVVILLIVAVLGGAALILGGMMLFAAPSAAPAAAVSSTQVPGATLPLDTNPISAVTSAAAPPQASEQVSLPALPANCTLQNHPTSQAVVTRVLADGSLEVQMGPSLARVAYAGIEILPGSAAGDQVEQAAVDLLEGKPVLLVRDSSETDASGRLLRYVFSAEHFVNYELVRQGLAAASPDSIDRACAIYLLEAEQQAHAEGLGGWKVTPIPTSTFIPFVAIDPDTTCDCLQRPECSQFQTHEEAQSCYNACNDYNSRLDDDRDGLACEELP